MPAQAGTTNKGKRICPLQYRTVRLFNLNKKMQGSKTMPRLAMLFLCAVWGILAGAAQAQTTSLRQLPEDFARNRVPQAHAEAPENERIEPPESPLPMPLPVPRPPERDELVTPVVHQESNAAETPAQVEKDATAAAEPSPSSGAEKTPLSPQNHKAKIPLAPNGKAGANSSSKSANGLPSMISIAGSTGLVLGIFLLSVWVFRRRTPQALVRLPGEAFEILGRAPLSGRQQVQLLRCGSRLLLVSITPGGAETLTEITDPLEVDRLSGLCRQSQPGSSSAAFKHIFEQLAPRRPAKNELYQHADGEYEMPADYRRGNRAWEDRHV
jgi:flagellar biogenesis protein FliO